MATWQFDMHALPSASAARIYGCTPLRIPRADMDDQAWWHGVASPLHLRADLARLLPSLKSWTSGIEQWGYEDGNRIDVVWDGEAITDFFIRLDVRDLSRVFLVNLMEFLRRENWLLRTQDEQVFRPSLTRLLSAIHKSDVFRFVQDPLAFLKALEDARQTESDDQTT